MIRSIINHENWTKTPNDVLKLMILETVDEIIDYEVKIPP